MSGYYYSTTSTGSYQAYTGSAYHMPVTCGEAGNITSIGVWCEEGGDGASTVKIALFNNTNPPDTRLHAGGNAAAPGEGAGTWIDIDISGSPVAVTLNQVVRVAFQGSLKIATQGASSGGYYTGSTYAGFPPTSFGEQDGAELMRVRVYVTAGGASSTPILKRRFNVLLRLCLSTFNLIWRCFK